MREHQDILTTGPLKEQLDRLYERATRIRGEFLDQAIWIERIIEELLSYEFFPNEADQEQRSKLITFVLNAHDFTFSAKVDILSRLLEVRHKKILKGHPTLFKSLKKIRQFRNRLAHSALDTSEEFLKKRHEDRIQIFYYEDGRKKKQVITFNDKNERLKECSSTLLDLLKIRDEMKQDLA